MGVVLQLYSFLNLGARWGGWSSARAGRLTHEKETPYPLYRTLGGPQGLSRRLRENWVTYANVVHNSCYIKRHCYMFRRLSHCHGDSYRYNLFGCYLHLSLHTLRVNSLCSLPPPLCRPQEQNYCKIFYDTLVFDLLLF
jgi:hypothetical protein